MSSQSNSHNPLGCCLRNAKSPLFYSSLMSTMHTSYFHTAVPMQAESTAGFSGKLLILAGYASLLFLLPMYSFPPITFPFLQRFNKDYKIESQQEKLLSADKEAKGSFCCYFQQRQEVQRDIIFRLALLWHQEFNALPQSAVFFLCFWKVLSDQVVVECGVLGMQEQ